MGGVRTEMGSYSYLCSVTGNSICGWFQKWGVAVIELMCGGYR